MSTKVEPEDLVILYDRMWQQFKEDRDAVTKQYADLRSYIDGNNDRYAINGDTLAKYAELMIKQTGQIVELIKLAKKETDSSSALNDSDFDHISSQIEKEEEKTKERPVDCMTHMDKDPDCGLCDPKPIREGTVSKGGRNPPPQSQQPPGIGATRPVPPQNQTIKEGEEGKPPKK